MAGGCTALGPERALAPEPSLLAAASAITPAISASAAANPSRLAKREPLRPSAPTRYLLVVVGVWRSLAPSRDAGRATSWHSLREPGNASARVGTLARRSVAQRGGASGSRAARISTRGGSVPSSATPSASRRARCASPSGKVPSALTTRHHGTRSLVPCRTLPARRGEPGE